MESFVGQLTTPGTLVLMAAGLHALAYVFQGQAALRITLLLGTFLYLIYYFVAGPEPLWAAIIGTSVIACTSIYGLIRLLVGRSTLVLSPKLKPIYALFSGIDPGVFKRLVAVGEVRTLDQETELLTENVVADNLYFLLDGAVRIKKNDRTFELQPHVFLGEVSLLLSSAASATVIAPPGAQVIIWRRANLKRHMERDVRLRLAVEALMARDIATKLAISHQG